jgi:hypothetical protein
MVDRDQYDAVQATTEDGRVLLAVSVPVGGGQVRVQPASAVGDFVRTDEWTGESRPVTINEDGLTLPVQPAGDGVLISLTR